MRDEKLKSAGTHREARSTLFFMNTGPTFSAVNKLFSNDLEAGSLISNVQN